MGHLQSNTCLRCISITLLLGHIILIFHIQTEFLRWPNHPTVYGHTSKTCVRTNSFFVSSGGQICQILDAYVTFPAGDDDFCPVETDSDFHV